MAHEIDTTTGKPSMAYAGDRGIPWHGLGTQLAGVATSEEMVAAAGLTWQIEKGPLYGGRDPQTGEPIEYADRFSLFRTDTGAPLGVCADIYQPWQISEQFAFLDSLIADGQAAYETAMSLRGGRTTVATLRLPTDIRVGDDRYYSYMLVSAGHDGRTGIAIAPTNVRVVCANTEDAALTLAEREKKLLKISHLPGIDSRLDEARVVLGITTEAQRRLAAMLEQMLAVDVSTAAYADVEVELFGKREDWTTRTKNAVQLFGDIFAEEAQHNGQTVYSLHQAITGYADHGMKQVGAAELRAERRLASLTSGPAAAMKAKGFEIAKTLANVS